MSSSIAASSSGKEATVQTTKDEATNSIPDHYPVILDMPSMEPISVKAMALSGKQLASATLLPSNPCKVIRDAAKAAFSPGCGVHIDLSFEGRKIMDTDTAEAIGLCDGAEISVTCSIWQPVSMESFCMQGEVGIDDGPMWCLVNGLVHIQGRLTFSEDVINDYVPFAALPREAWPFERRVWEQSRCDGQGNARLALQTDGVLSIKPGCSVWLAATWRAVAAPADVTGDCIDLPVECPSSALKISRYHEGTVQLEGSVKHKGAGNRNSQYVVVASLPPGFLTSGSRSALFEQSLAGVWGDARLEILGDGRVQLKPDYNTHVCCMMYTGKVHNELEFEWGFQNLVDSSKTSVGVAFADGLIHLQGKISLRNNSSASQDFSHVATLPPKLSPCRELVFQQAKVGVWGDARLRVRTDGTLWLKPQHSVWIAASWRPL